MTLADHPPALETLRPGLPHYPLVKTFGLPWERGVQYGSAAAERVAHTLRAYRELFIAYADLSWSRVTEYALRYESIIADFDSGLVKEMKGIAHGAGVDFADVLAINVRTEVMYGLGELRAVADCTAFAALPQATADGHTIVGQNWDWHPAAFDSCVILSIQQPDAPSIVTVVEAGLLSKVGMNSEGLGVATNAMVTTGDVGDPGIPYHVLLRVIQNAATFEEAVSVVTNARRASSANYLIAHKSGRTIDLEAAPGGPDQVFQLEPRSGIVGHANCFISPHATIQDQTAIRKPLGLTRQRTMDRLLDTDQGKITVDTMKVVLSDHEHHPNALCRHPLETLEPVDRSATVASVIMDLDAGEMWVADGQPCTYPHRRFTAADLWRVE